MPSGKAGIIWKQGGAQVQLGRHGSKKLIAKNAQTAGSRNRRSVRRLVLAACPTDRLRHVFTNGPAANLVTAAAETSDRLEAGGGA